MRFERCELKAAIEAVRRIVAALDPDAIPLFESPEVWATSTSCRGWGTRGRCCWRRRVDESCTWRSEGYRSRRRSRWRRSRGRRSRRRNRCWRRRSGLRSCPRPRRWFVLGRCRPRRRRWCRPRRSLRRIARTALLELAVSAPYGKVRKASLSAKASVGIDETHARITRERSLREYTDDEGAWGCTAAGRSRPGWRSGPRRSIRSSTRILQDQARIGGDREPREAYAFDALIELADGSSPPSRRSRRGRYLGLIRADSRGVAARAGRGRRGLRDRRPRPIPVPRRAATCSATRS